MGFETISGTNLQYALISFDADGQERQEESGLMTETLRSRLASDPPTHIFLFCHGWQGDLPAARQQYCAWVRALANSVDRAGPAASFRPLYIGIHWPSLPFGDEEIRGGAFGAAAPALNVDALLETYLERLGDRAEIRTPLALILEEARRNAAADELPPSIIAAYLDLNAALGLGAAGPSAPPDADREGFDPQDCFDAASDEGAAFGAGSGIGNALLAPLRALSFWHMKRRARRIGEGGLHDFLSRLQAATNAATRIHLMGHSFGTIVVSSMLGGPEGKGRLARPVDSLALIQGAVSLWSYAPRIPFAGSGPGYYSGVLTGAKVRGPIITTRSKFDDAVGVWYPLASRLHGAAFVAGLPKYGGMGTFGIQGLADEMCSNLMMQEATAPYAFQPAKVYNLDGSRFISHKQGLSGAHSDIAGPEVAHAIWAAASVTPTP
jgi:hypothetical protein